MLCAPPEVVALQNGLAAAAAAIDILLSRHLAGTATAHPGEIHIEHANVGVGRHRTRIRHNGTFGVFEAVWFGDPAIGGVNLYLGEDRRLSAIILSVLSTANALPDGVEADAETRSLLAEADRIIAAPFPS